MKHLLISLITLNLLSLSTLAHQTTSLRQVSGTHKVTYTQGYKGKESSITINLSDKKIESFVLEHFDKPIVINKEELKDIEKIQIDTIVVNSDTVNQAFSVIAKFGQDVGSTEAVFKRIKLFFQEGTYTHYDIYPSSRTYVAESTKQKGKPLTKVIKNK